MIDSDRLEPAGQKRRLRHWPAAGGPAVDDELAPPDAGSQEPRAPVRWEYQWEDSLNALGERVVEPPLQERLTDEVARAASVDAPSCLVFVRGELGIGKSTLAAITTRRMAEAQVGGVRVTNALMTCAVLEAGDLESPIDFARRINEHLTTSSRAIVLARPATLEAAGQWVRVPDATVTMHPFEPARPLFGECVRHVCAQMGIGTPELRERVAALARRLPTILQTPFYFMELANFVKSSQASDRALGRSPLEILQASLDVRIGAGGFDQLVQCAFGERHPEDARPVSGILEPDGFRHDGYRNVILAVAVIDGSRPFHALVRARNAMNAVRIILDHIVHTWRRRALDFDDPLVQQLRRFVVDVVDDPAVPYLVYLQGLVAECLQQLGGNEVAGVLRERCIQLINQRTAGHGESGDTVDRWWDVSDALSLVGDPRLRTARRRAYRMSDSGYFTFLDGVEIEIGSDHMPRRTDDAKPVLPYVRGPVTIGPLWVANFLVTTEQFAEFWSPSPDAEHFTATGRQWYRQDPDLIAEIGDEFERAAQRCFWKEVRERQQVDVGARAAGPMSILDIARLRALRSDRVQLWDPTQADSRFSAAGNPVVGVNWWEAMAYCAWWTAHRLRDAGFPPDSKASLLTDWEWEGIRRRFYDPGLEDRVEYDAPRYPAHLRDPSDSGPSRGRLTNVVRPLHVGLAPVPAGPGPFDMVGNVWEWTRSRVFGHIVEADAASGQYGATAWDDGDVTAEREPMHVGREVTTAEDDLSYRAVRGASFFSIDHQAAWHPAYRLCDPPFSSYFDLGFRLAVYPPGHDL